MSELELPQIYLITPPDFDFREFPEEMARVLDATEVACVRLALATTDEDRILRSADALREPTIWRDLRVGKHAHLFVTDLRTFRADHLVPEDALPGRVVVDEPRGDLALLDGLRLLHEHLAHDAGRERGDA